MTIELLNKKKYIIVKLSDAKALVELYKDYVVFSNLLCEAKTNYKDNIVLPSKELFDRFQKETGADIVDIVNQLKGVTYCHACVIEGQEHSCNCLHVNKLGRRLSRLIDRANND